MPRSVTRLPLSCVGFASASLALALCLWPEPASAQSFNCQMARSADEAMICDEPGLARLDAELGTLYRTEFGRLDKDQREAFQQHETLFLNARRRCAVNYRCIEQSYHNRIRELQDMLSNDASGQSTEAASAADLEPDRRADRRSGSSSKEAVRSPEKRGRDDEPRSATTERSAAEDRASLGNAPPAPPPVEPPRRSSEKKTAAAPPAPPPEVHPSEHSVVAEPAPEPPPVRRHEKRHRKETIRQTETEAPGGKAAASLTASAPEAKAAEAGGATKPAIRWVDPPPTR